MPYRKGQPKRLKNLVAEKTIRLNDFGDTAWKQVQQFFQTIALQPITNSVLVSLAVCNYRRYLTRELKKANVLKDRGLEKEYMDALKTLVAAELQKVQFIRER